MDDWIEIRNTPFALKYFPDDFDQVLTYILENQLKGEREWEDAMKWDSDYLDLMEYTKNPNYGRLKCFQCLLSPDGDDPIFIGINRLVTKGLTNGQQQKCLSQYPCEVVSRFQCPYERSDNKEDDDGVNTYSNFDVEELFKLRRMAFAVEISLAKARKEDSKLRIKNKGELLQALTDKGTFAKILEQGAEACEINEDIRTYIVENQNYILDYFTKMMDRVNLEELLIY